MNRPAHIPTEVHQYEPVAYAAWSYVMTPDKFADGCFIVTDAHTGRQIGSGENGFGLRIRLPLNVPLCRGCDRVIDNHVCDFCEVVFTGEAPK